MDRNTIVGLLLMLALLLGFGYWNGKQTKENQAQQAQQKEQTTTQNSSDASNSQVITPNAIDTTAKAKQQAASKNNTPFYRAEAGNNDSPFVEIKTDIATYSIAKQGGYLAAIEYIDIYKSAPKGEEKEKLQLFNGDNNAMNMELLLPNQMRVQTKDCYFFAQNGVVQLDENRQQLSMKLVPMLATDSGAIPDFNSYIEYIYTFENGSYELDFDIQFKGMEPYLYPNTDAFSLLWDATLLSPERNYEYEKSITTAYYMDNSRKVDHLSETSSDKKEFSSDLKWCSFKQQFFTSVLIADSGYFSSGEIAVDAPNSDTPPVLKRFSAILDFRVDNINDGKFDMSWFIGPNQYKLLEAYDLNLERQVPLGWGFLIHWINRLAVIPIFDWLTAYDLSFGIIILIITIILKLVLLPVAYKTYVSSAKMRALKPEIQEIADRYPKQEDAMKKQQATMTLYRSAGANPLAGCLPTLLQLPILFALFRFFPAAYELRQQSFLWADDLSSYDSVLDLGFSIPFYGDHVSLFCLLMTIATLAYTWINNKLMSPTGNADQMRMMKIFMYIMPIMFLGFFNNFASGLTYYYFMVNIITFAQMGFFRLVVDEKKLREKLLLNMQKPVKKSKWQKRMEDMVKQQQTKQAQMQKKRK